MLGLDKAVVESVVFDAGRPMSCRQPTSAGWEAGTHNR
jgi:hypothetical protein